MGNAKIITKELDIHAFQAGIFISDADMFSPVAVYPRGMECRTSYQFYEEQKMHPSLWMAYAGPAGIGQYSLRRGRPVGVLARFDVHFRHPTKEEMQTDFEEFGYQVIGPAVIEVPESERGQYKGNGIFKLRGEEHYFVGQLRLIKSLFLSRVFSGDLPTDVSDLVMEVDGVAETGEMIIPQGYQFLHAIDGEIKYLPFEKVEDYDTSKLKLFGFVEIEDGRMTFYPNGDRSHQIDFTQTMHD